MPSPARLLPVLLLLAASGCGERREDDGRGEVPDVPVEAIDDAGRVMLSPAESAAAVRAVEAHSRAVRDSVRRASGVGGDATPPPPPPAGPAPRTHAECMAQAAEAEGDEREVLERVCRHLPGAPATPR